MVSSYKAASDIEVLTSNFPIPGFGLVPDQRVRHQGLGADPGRHRNGRGERRVHGRAAVGHRSRRSAVDLAHAYGLRPHRQPEPAARREPADPGDHDVSGRRHHEPAPPRCRWTGSIFVNPGQKITLGDRTLTAVKPPAFDNPSTTGFHDETSGAFFSSDCFGALLSDRAAERRRPLRTGPAGGPGLLGDGRLAVAAQGGPGRVREGARRHPQDGADDGPEQPPARGPGRHDRAAARLAGRRPGCSAVRRAGSGGTRADAQADDGGISPDFLISLAPQMQR